MSAIAISALGAVAGAASKAIGSAVNEKKTKKERERQIRLENYNKKLNRQKYFSSLHYSSPVVKVQQMKAAGLNPYVDTSAVAPSSPEYGSEVSSSPVLDPSSGELLASMGDGISNIANTALQQEANDISASRLGLEEKAQQIEKDKLEFEKDKFAATMMVGPNGVASILDITKKGIPIQTAAGKGKFGYDSKGNVVFVVPNINGEGVDLKDTGVDSQWTDGLATDLKYEVIPASQLFEKPELYGISDLNVALRGAASMVDVTLKNEGSGLDNLNKKLQNEYDEKTLDARVETVKTNLEQAGIKVNIIKKEDFWFNRDKQQQHAKLAAETGVLNTERAAKILGMDLTEAQTAKTKADARVSNATARTQELFALARENGLNGDNPAHTKLINDWANLIVKDPEAAAALYGEQIVPIAKQIADISKATYEQQEKGLGYTNTKWKQQIVPAVNDIIQICDGISETYKNTKMGQSFDTSDDSKINDKGKKGEHVFMMLKDAFSEWSK